MSKKLDILNSSVVQEYISNHINEDPSALALKGGGSFFRALQSKHPEIHLGDVITQIKSRKKIKDKIPSWANHNTLLFPTALSVEQCSSEATSTYKINILKSIDRQSFIDLTGGLGVDSYFLGKQFESAIYIEQNHELFEFVKHNFQKLNFEAKLYNQDAIQFLESYFEQNPTFIFDCIYLDPFRRDKNNKKQVEIKDCSPNFFDIIPLIKNRCKKVLIKLSPMIDIHQALIDVSFVEKVIITTVQYECKEVLLLIDFMKSSLLDVEQGPEIQSVHLTKNGQPIHSPFSFTFQKEKEASISPSEVKKYIMEPHAGILKAGAFKMIAKSFEVSPLNPSTHLYTSDSIPENFPGKVWKVACQSAYNKRAFMATSALAPQERINVLTRNFQDKPDIILKKLKLKPGGDKQLIAFKDKNNKPTLVIGERMDHLK